MWRASHGWIPSLSKLFSGVKPPSVAILLGHAWKPLDVPLYKINCDAVVCVNGNRVGIGVIIRDSNGDVMFSASKKIGTGLAPSIAEASAIYEGMKLVAETGLLPAMVEFDLLSVVNLILAGQPIRSEIGLVIEDILELKVLHGFSSFVFSPRTSYRVAHSLAKMVVTHAMDIVSLEKVPPSIRSLVQEEAIFS
ncbi:hypothetical protein ACOSP7_016821 [Xanthoceras sorbifolium]